MKYWVIGGTTAFAMLAGLLTLQRPSQGHAGGVSSGSAMPTGAAEQLTELQSRIDALQLQTYALQARSTESAAPATSAPEAQNAEMAPEQRNALVYAETKARFQQRFERDGGTSEWARSTERDLRTSLKEVGHDWERQVSSIDCRSEICRVATEHESPAQSVAFMDEMESRPGFRGLRFVRLRVTPGREEYEFFIEARTTRAVTVESP